MCWPSAALPHPGGDMVREGGVHFYPASYATSAAVQDQEGDWCALLVTDDETA